MAALWASALSGFLGAYLFLAAPVLLAWLQYVSPTTPQPATGQESPMSNHTAHFYVQEWQAKLENGLLLGGLLLVFVAILSSRLLHIGPKEQKRLLPWIRLAYIPFGIMFVLAGIAVIAPMLLFPPRGG